MSINNILNVSQSGISAAQNTLQTVSHNIANANTPGYSRQVVSLANASGGLGVQVRDISRQLDLLLDRRQELGVGESGRLDARERFLSQIEQIFNEMGTPGLNDRLDALYTAADSLMDNPTNPVGREEFVTKADGVARHVQGMSRSLSGLLTPVDQEVDVLLADINNRLRAIRDVNVAIAGSEESGSADLRDQRRRMIMELGKLIDIQTLEIPGGAVQISMGGGQGLLADTVHAATLSRSPEMAVDPSVPTAPGEPPELTRFRGISLDGRPVLRIQGGALGGLVEVRDTLINGKNGFLTRLEALADTMRFQFNRIGSTSVSQSMFTSQTGVVTLGRDLGSPMRTLSTDPEAPNYQGAPVDMSQLLYTLADPPIVEGEEGRPAPPPVAAKQILFATGVDGSHLSVAPPVVVTEDMSIAGLVSAINRTGVINASITPDNRLRLQGANGLKYGVISDDSNVLAILGIGALFAGDGAWNMAANPALLSDSRTLGVGRINTRYEDPNDRSRATHATFDDGNNQAALAISQLRTTKFDISGRETSLTGNYAATVGMVGAVVNQNRDSSMAQKAAQDFLETLRQSTSGVSMEEELTDLLRFQRAFQASSKLVSTADELFQTIIQMV
ncbi:MAG: flagellar hook-associated protein FlgK [Magnetococcales bacterium]|nr:flagellar hook-associated protein FlgK [Magnetococcales bacterium]